MIRYSFCLTLVFLVVSIRSQNLMWAKSVPGIYSDMGRAVAVDKAGYVFYGGDFTGGSVDFDPGPGTYTLGPYAAGFISKLDANGNFVWAKQFGGSVGAARVYAMTLDSLSNIYMTGVFQGTVDFNPGPSVFNLVSPGSGPWDIFISKFDSAGNFIWIKQFTGSFFSEFPSSIKLDKYRNVYTTGYFINSLDFDPGPSVYQLFSAGQEDIYVSKLDSSGNFVYAVGFGSGNLDVGLSLDVNDKCEVYVTGCFSGVTDFDPGVSSYTVNTLGGKDIFVCKFDSSSAFQWVRTFGGSGEEISRSVNCFKNHCVYFGGSIESSNIDFDPGPGTYTVPFAGGSDQFFSKFDAYGNLIWTKSVGASSGDAVGAMDKDSDGNIYLTGGMTYTVDFDPGPAVYNLNGVDIFVSKYDSLANLIWAGAMGTGGGGSYPNSIIVDKQRNIHTVGSFSNIGDFDPGPGIFYPTYNSTEDIYMVKLGCAPSIPNAILGNTVVCPGTSKIYSVAPVYGASVYTWVLPSGWSGTSITNTISVITGTSGGVISAAVSNTCGTSAPKTLTVNVPVVSVTSNSICAGQTATLIASGANNYTWTPGNIFTNPAFVTPTITTQYTVTGFFTSYSCTNSVTFTQSVSTCTGIDQAYKVVNEINIYPNPFPGKFIVSRTSITNETIEIYNVLGESVLSFSQKNREIEIDLSDKPYGIYFVKVGASTFKIVKQ